MIPTFKQWKNWSLPSKYAFISVILGLIALGFAINDRFYSLSEDKANTIVQNDIGGIVFIEKITNPVEGALVSIPTLELKQKTNKDGIFLFKEKPITKIQKLMIKVNFGENYYYDGFISGGNIDKAR